MSENLQPIMLCIPIPSVDCVSVSSWCWVASHVQPDLRLAKSERWHFTAWSHSQRTNTCGGGALLCSCEQGTQLFCVKMSPHWHARYNSTVLVSEMWYYPWVAETNQWLSDTGQKIILTRWLSAEWLNMSWNVITEGEKGNERWWIISNKYWESDQLLVIRK